MKNTVFLFSLLFSSVLFSQIKKETIQLLEKAEKSDIRYFNIITHDFYFSDSFEKWKNWYIWLINYLNTKGFEFLDYRKAIKNLNLMEPSSTINSQ